MSRSGKLVTMVALGLFAGSISGGAALADDDLEYGARLFKQCAQCHQEDGSGSQLALAPAIAGFSQWYVASQLRAFKTGLRGLHPDDVGGLRMYPMMLTLKDDRAIDSVAAYVASLPPQAPEPVLSGGDPKQGAELYKTCTQCHGADGAGNEALKAPKLSGSSDWYLLTSLQKYKSGVRGSNPKNTYAQLMRGMSANLRTEQSMKDVIAHIMTLDD